MRQATKNMMASAPAHDRKCHHEDAMDSGWESAFSSRDCPK